LIISLAVRPYLLVFFTLGCSAHKLDSCLTCSLLRPFGESIRIRLPPGISSYRQERNW
jgi:hypothetical protein